jgi:hypothetical protein
MQELLFEKEATKSKIGRRAYQPTTEDRLKVSRMCALGTPQYQIAIVMDMAPRTLRKHFRKELTEAAIEANFKVADTLYTMATSGKDIAATIFWAKTRNGFKVPVVAPPEPKAPEPAVPKPPSTIVLLNNDGAPLAKD